MVNDKNSKGLLSWQDGGRMPQQLWAFDDYTEVEDQPAEFATGLTSLGFIRAALRRSRWLWRGLAALGLVAGVAFFFRLPTVYQASTSLLLTPIVTGGEDAGAPITNEVTIAQSREVAGLAVSKLGLHETVSKFLTSYTVTPTTDRVLFITVSAPSSSEAVNRANVLAQEFLKFRAGLLESQQQLVVNSLNQQLSQAESEAEVHHGAGQPGVGPDPLTCPASQAEQPVQAADPGDHGAGHPQASGRGHQGGLAGHHRHDRE